MFELKPCPFCGGESIIRAQMGHLYISPIHKKKCVIKPDTWLQSSLPIESKSKHGTGGMTMARLIDADEAKANIITFATECGSTILPIDAILMILNQIDTVDTIPVVRCRDCKHCDPENHHCDHHMGTAAPLRRKPDDFCSYGERKEGAN